MPFFFRIPPSQTVLTCIPKTDPGLVQLPLKPSCPEPEWSTSPRCLSNRIHNHKEPYPQYPRLHRHVSVASITYSIEALVLPEARPYLSRVLSHGRRLVCALIGATVASVIGLLLAP